MAWNWWGRGRGRGRMGWGPGWGPLPPQVLQPPELEPGLMPLSLAPQGARVVVRAIVAGQGAYYRILSLGIAPGTELEVVENLMTYPWSPVIVRVRGVEVALGRGMADKVLVKIVSAPSAGGAENKNEK
ncbi:MAG: ferrous iron transport protein A [Desulfurococcales archaeon]|nr:ferrous iron transport protein A [Desulfurococcales archaeon]